jgi:hypothetical protein
VSFLYWPVVIPVVVAFIALAVFHARAFTWVLANTIGIYVFLRYGFTVPIPMSVILIYMGITVVALGAYVSSSTSRTREFLAPVDSLVNEPKLRPLLLLLLLLFPALAAGNAYMASKVTLEAPVFGRTVHPAPPDQIQVHQKSINIATARNPLRALEQSDPAAFRKHVANGKNIYYRNCLYCHGDALAGDGMFAHAVNPIPTNFTDPGTIPMLQESFLFWRISKGGPGLPAEGGPWDSAMPAWEKFLTEEEMWEVVLFLYDHTGSRPRAEAEHH